MIFGQAVTLALGIGFFIGFLEGNTAQHLVANNLLGICMVMSLVFLAGAGRLIMADYRSVQLKVAARPTKPIHRKSRLWNPLIYPMIAITHVLIILFIGFAVTYGRL